MALRKDLYYFNDDGAMVAMRYERWKAVFLENRGVGFGVWREPFVTRRAPKLFDLRMDPFERADESSNAYNDWVMDRVYLFVPAQAPARQFYESFRAFSQQGYGIPPHQVIGSTFALEPGEADGRVTLTRQPRVDFIDDGPGKPAGIARHIGQRPIAAFGNSDCDWHMLRYTTEGPGRRLGMIIRHDDAAREFAYDHDSHVGRLARALDEAPERGWQVVSMSADWSRIFP